MFPRSCYRLALVALVLIAPLTATAYAQKTDIVTLRNGDRITGEVEQLDRGRLEYSTDDGGTIYFEWDKVVSVQSKDQFEVGTSDGRRFLGTLSSGGPQLLVVTGPSGPVTVATSQVTMIDPIGRSFWSRVDGSLDIGFSYTKSSSVTQLNANSTTTYRKPRSEFRVTGSATLTDTGEGDEADDRGTAQASYLRYRGQNMYFSGGAGVDSNESLGLILRTQGAFVAGRRLVNSNRAQLAMAGGVSVNNEQAVDSDPTKNIEALYTFRTSYYSYDRPKTNVDVSLQYYASLNDWGRQRIQLDSAFKREFWKDVFFSLNVFDTFDSRPPTEGADNNDVGVTFAFGWTY